MGQYSDGLGGKTILAIILLLNSGVSLYASSKHLVGASQITLLAPQGFFNASQYKGFTSHVLHNATPKTNRLISYYLPPKDLYRVKHGANAFLNRYMVVQTHHRFETRDISATQFSMVQNASKQRHKELISQLLATKGKEISAVLPMLKRGLGAETTFKLGKPAPLGVVSEGKNHLTMAYIFNYQSNFVAGLTHQYRIGTVSIVRVKDKLLFLYVYGGFESEKDFIWAKHTSRQWVNNILSQNLVQM